MTGPVPATRLQSGLWFLSQAHPGVPLYSMPLVLRLRGPVNPGCAAAALRYLIDSHEILRLRFAPGEAGPELIPAEVLPEPRFADLRRSPDPVAAWAELLRAELAEPVDLSAGAGHRSVIAALGAEDCAIAMVVHHACADARSLEILLDDFCTAYRAIEEAGAPPEPRPVPAYRELARRWRQDLEDRSRQAGLAYWSGELADVEDFALAADWPRPAIRSLTCTEYRLELPAGMLDRVDLMCRESRVSRFMAFAAVLAVLLARWTGDSGDPVLAVPQTLRRAAWLEDVVAPLVQTLPLRLPVDQRGSFRDLLAVTRAKTAAAMAHAGVTFGEIVGLAGRRGDPATQPLTSVAFQVASSFAGRRDAGTVTVESFDLEPAARDTDLTWDIMLTEDGGWLSVKYADEVFDRATVARLAMEYVALAEALAARADTPLHQVEHRDAAELERLWALGLPPHSAECPQACDLAALFGMTASAHPGRVALIDGRESWTYAELAAKAARIRAQLQGAGVSGGDVVALALRRRGDFIAAMISVVASGAAYLPIDVEQPAGRSAAAIAKTRPAVIVTDARDPWPSGGCDVPVVLLGEAVPGPAMAARAPAGPDDLCYVMCTSGTTGEPKAVAVTHRGVSSLACRPPFARIGPGEVLLQLAPLSFDAATFEVWGALLNGATLVLPGRGLLKAAEIGQLIRSHGVTVLHLTAGLLRVVAEGDPGCFARLHTLLTGGDVIPVAQVRALMRSHPGLTVVACYGPTENTTFSSVAVLTEPPGRLIPLGQALPGRSVHVLDDWLRPVSPGAIGEICVGGGGLARGYLADPGQTAASFVPHPGPRAPAERLYRTGDIARVRADGELEFLGRRDSQIKVRGYRIEPSEVEAALLAHPGVQRCVVRARGHAGDRSLTAYVVTESPRTAAHPGPTAGELRAHLRGLLPEPMIPGSWLLLDELPLTAQGKVDGPSLDKLPVRQTGPESGHRQLSPTEAMVHEIWCSCLRQERIGVTTDFFEAGGHSLAALRIAGQLERRLARPVPLAEFLRRPSIAEFAAWIDECSPPGPRDRAPVVTARPSSSEDPAETWPLTPPQSALWFLENFNPGSSFYVVGLGLVLRGRLDTAALQVAFGDIVTRHQALGARFLTLDGRPYQVFVPGQAVALDLRDLSAEGDPEAAAREVLDELATAPFNLGSEPPLRARLVRLSEQRHALLLAVHHIVFDGWSAQVLLSDLGAAYESRSANRPVTLPALGIGVGEYAARLAGLDTGLAETELAYWRETLRAAPVVNLPADHPRPGIRQFDGAACGYDLDRPASEALRKLSRQLGTSLFTVLAAAFTRLVSRLSGTDDVVIGVPLAGRTEARTHNLVGFFANTLPLRVDLTGAGTFRDAVERHRAPVRELLLRQHVPFARLVEALAPRRSASRNPYFDICFQYLPAADQGVRFGNLELGFLDGTRQAAQFDLSCDVHEVGDHLRIQFEYSTELFSEPTIQAHLAAYAGLLREVAGKDQGGLAPTPGAHLRRWEPPQPAGGLAGIVAAQARSRPGAPAVRSAGQRALSFAQLDDAAARFATLLGNSGVSAGDAVGVLLEPGTDLAISILAILRTGASYVPGDVRTPPARTASALRQAGCRLLVHGRASLDPAREAASQAGVPTLRLDSGALSGHPPAPLRELSPASDAYVIFTSGSAGRQKGVRVPHCAATALAVSAAEVYELTPGDVVLQLASAAVDVSVEEFFAAWQAGACVFASGPVIDDLSALVAEQGLTVLNLPAALWHEWTRQAVAGDCVVPPCVRLVIAGSDRVDPHRVRQWRAGPGAGIRLLNAYGVTEATVSSAWYDTAGLAADAVHTTQVPIGGPFPHVALHVLDEAGVRVPDGAPGELYIGGAGVALGYLGDPGGTAASFLPDPFGAGAGHRMYRTGDQVRRLPSGALDFRGRKDTQVKIRGSRIELAEIERVAAEVPGVAEFVADARPDDQGTIRLVGYVRLSASSDRDLSLARDRVEEWRQIHDADVFNEVPEQQAADLNASGWLSSYTLEPIPAEAMAQWRDETVARLLEEKPGRVLEIGCGTGMILLRVAPEAGYYLGTDISARALGYVRAQLDATGLADRVELRQAAAHELAALGSDQFDLVVVNSVVQYFPSESYLSELLESAWRLLRPGGRMLIGDVRDLTLLRAFHLSVQLFRQAGEDPQALLGSVAEYVETESELCLAPAYFLALDGRLPELGEIDVRAKAGRADTEMNGFRYDVILRREPAAAPGPPEPESIARIDGTALTIGRFGDIVDELRGQPAVISPVTDSRLARPLALAAELPRAASLADAERAASSWPPGVHPADLVAAAAARGRRIAVRHRGEGFLDVVVSDRPVRPEVLASTPASTQAHANRPLDTVRRRSIIAAVREHLGRSLIKPMIPGRVVFIDAFPVTTGGKVDRKRLPDPPRTSASMSSVLAPTPLERTLAAAWQQVLGAVSVGPADNFFEIGGDSISWLQIMSRCSREGIRLSARDIFEHQSVGALAAIIESRRQSVASADATAAETAAEPALEAGLTPIQHWFMESFPAGRDHQNQSQWYRLPPGCQETVLRQALCDVAAHHDVLTVRFAREGGEWRLRAGEPLAAESVPLTQVRLPAAGPDADAVLSAHSGQAQDALSVAAGPLFRVVVFRTPDSGPDLMLWCIHHLAVDAVSWQFLDEDLDAALTARGAGIAPVLPARTSSYLDWSAWSGQAAGRLDASELDYWRVAARAPALAIPLRHQRADARYGAAHRHVTTVAAAEIGRAPGDLVLAAALAAVRAALAPVTGCESGSVWLEYHGRSLEGAGPDVTRTVGWFTSLFPFAVAEPDLVSLRARLNAVPGGGVGYGRARYLAGHELASSANVVVNYVTAAAQTEDAQTEDAQQGDGRRLRSVPQPSVAGSDVAADAPMPFALELNLARAGAGQIVADCTFSARHFDGHEAEHLARSLGTELERELANLARTPPRFELVPQAVRTSPAFTDLAERAAVAEAYPLTPMQQLMLNRHLLLPAGDANYDETVLTLSGELDPDRFRSAWRALAGRHEVLRTSVEWAGLPQPVQVVYREVPSAIRYLDWSALSEGRVERRIALLLAEQRAKAPALSGTPPFRLTLIKTGPRQARLVWIDHHILLDGWSSSVLINELLDAYDSISRGAPAFAGAQPPVPYGDYLRWAGTRDAGQARTYWRGALEGFTAPTELPFDRPPSALAGASEDYAESDAELPPGLAAALRRLARERRTTLGSVLAAGWALFLRQFTRDSQVSFGMALSGRPPELGEVSAMVGLYLTTLPLSVRIDAGSSIGELVDSVTRQSWQLGEVSAAGSLWDIYEWAGIPVSRTLFHSVLVVQNFSRPADRDRAGQRQRQLSARMTQSQLLAGVPLTIAVEPSDSGGEGGIRLVWDRRAFAPQTAQRVLSEYLALLATMCDGQELPLAGLPILGFGQQLMPGQHEPRGADDLGEPPRGPAEQRIAQAWQEVLGIPSVGRDVNLFDAGANSVTVMRLHARLAELFDATIALAELFQFPTVRGMAALLGASATRAPASSAARSGRSQQRRAALTAAPRRAARHGPARDSALPRPTEDEQRQ